METFQIQPCAQSTESMPTSTSTTTTSTSTNTTATAATAMVPPRNLPRQPLGKHRLRRHRRAVDLSFVFLPPILDDGRTPRTFTGVCGRIVHRVDLCLRGGGIERGALSPARDERVWVLDHDGGGVLPRGVGGVLYAGASRLNERERERGRKC
mmetsp:Transcript_11595/g.24049  ORF Transcript_11595/g.24049 Transcript_11595/m.24049 type:complete len:153 (+) Transcript_11595:263-721(+)